MTRPKQHARTETDLPAIPSFLRRRRAPAMPRRTGNPPQPRKRQPLAPDSMMPILQAVNTGRDTLRKLRASLRESCTDREIRGDLAALMRIHGIYRVARRYPPITRKTPPPASRP